MLFDYWKISPPSHVLQRMRYEYKPPADLKEKLKAEPTDLEFKILRSMPGKSIDNEPLYRQDAIRRALEDLKARQKG